MPQSLLKSGRFWSRHQFNSAYETNNGSQSLLKSGRSGPVRIPLFYEEMPALLDDPCLLGFDIDDHELPPFFSYYRRQPMLQARRLRNSAIFGCQRTGCSLREHWGIECIFKFACSSIKCRIRYKSWGRRRDTDDAIAVTSFADGNSAFFDRPFPIK